MGRKHTLATLIVLVLLTGASALAQDYSALIRDVSDARIVGQNRESTFLGKIMSEYNNDSIFNIFGDYGNKDHSNTIWSEFGVFGSPFSLYSALNEHSSKPPMIIKDGKVIGYLTTNKSIVGAIDPLLLKSIKSQFKSPDGC
jgi:hypothetical protein